MLAYGHDGSATLGEIHTVYALEEARATYEALAAAKPEAAALQVQSVEPRTHADQEFHFQTIRLPQQSERMAWLAAQVSALPGHGIIYTLTVRDAVQLAAWLQSRGLNVESYTGETREFRPPRVPHSLNSLGAGS